MRFTERKEEQQILTDTFGGKWAVSDTHPNDLQVLWLSEELKAIILKYEKGLSLYPQMQFNYRSAAGNEVFRKQTVKFNCGLVTMMITKDISAEVLSDSDLEIPKTARALFQGLRLSVWTSRVEKENEDSCLDIEVDCPGELILLIELIMHAVKLGELAVMHNLKRWVANNEDES